MGAIVKVRNVKLGDGMPKICIPVTDTNLDDLKKSVNLIRNTPFDLIEWRADFYTGMEDPEIRIKAMTLFRNALGNIPVLFTIRTSVEGGMMEIDTETYTKTILAVIDSGLIDLVDVELSRGEETMKTIVAAAHRVGVKVVASRHDFTATPDKNIIVNNLCLMQSLGADIVKFAVMPQCERDVLTLLDATLTMKEEHSDTPVITMSMSPTGVISRICGQLGRLLRDLRNRRKGICAGADPGEPVKHVPANTGINDCSNGYELLHNVPPVSGSPLLTFC